MFFLACTSAAFAQVKAEDRSCVSDSDCALITISCNSCCPAQWMNEVAAVSQSKAKTYEGLGVCTPEHLKSCGVPECGHFPAPYPVAVCQQGTCAVTQHPADDYMPPQWNAPAAKQYKGILKTLKPMMLSNALNHSGEWGFTK
jgi:hypothetical protein